MSGTFPERVEDLGIEINLDKLSKIKEHHFKTLSYHAKYLIDNWYNEKLCFWQVVPKEMIYKYEQPVLVDKIKSA